MTSEYFRATHKKWFIIANESYDKKREIQGFGGFADIPEVNDDVENAKAGFIALGARETDIKVFQNANWLTMKSLVAEVKQDINTNMRHNEKTCIYLYYAGHGGMVDNYTVCVLNEPKNYPIEKQLRMLANESGAYVIAVLDCCREKLPQATRGTGENVEFAEVDSGMNLILTFGCEPSRTTAAKSTISKEYFKNLSDQADGFSGEVSIPQALFMWKGSNEKVEHFYKFSSLMKFQHTDWKPKPGSRPSTTTQGDNTALEAKLDKLLAAQEQAKQSMAPQAQPVATGISAPFQQPVAYQQPVPIVMAMSPQQAKKLQLSKSQSSDGDAKRRKEAGMCCFGCSKRCCLATWIPITICLFFTIIVLAVVGSSSDDMEDEFCDQYGCHEMPDQHQLDLGSELCGNDQECLNALHEGLMNADHGDESFYDHGDESLYDHGDEPYENCTWSEYDGYYEDEYGNYCY